jgi:hypothetical protein
VSIQFINSFPFILYFFLLNADCVQLLLKVSRMMPGDSGGETHTTLSSTKEPETGDTATVSNMQNAKELSAKFSPDKVMRSPPWGGELDGFADLMMAGTQGALLKVTLKPFGWSDVTLVKFPNCCEAVSAPL